MQLYLICYRYILCRSVLCLWNNQTTVCAICWRICLPISTCPVCSNERKIYAFPLYLRSNRRRDESFVCVNVNIAARVKLPWETPKHKCQLFRRYWWCNKFFTHNWSAKLRHTLLFSPLWCSLWCPSKCLEKYTRFAGQVLSLDVDDKERQCSKNTH